MPPRQTASRKSAQSGAANLHIYVGTDGARVKEQAMAKLRELEPTVGGEFGVETISGIAENAASAQEACELVRQALLTLPFLGGGKVVWFKGVNFLGDHQTGRAQATQDAWAKVVETLDGLAAEVHFILSGDKPDRRRTGWKALETLASPAYLDLPDASRDGWQQDVARRARERAIKLDFEFHPEALELFVHLAGENTRTVDSEVDKLSLFVGEGGVADTRAVRSLVASSRAGVIFELGDAIGRRRLGQALEALRHFTSRNENPVGLLLAAIVPKVRNLLVAKDLFSRHRLPENSYQSFQAALDRLPREETAHLPRTKTGKLNAYPLFLSLREARQFEVPELRAGLSACLDANRRLVSTTEEPTLVLTDLLTRLCRQQSN